MPVTDCLSRWLQRLSYLVRGLVPSALAPLNALAIISEAHARALTERPCGQRPGDLWEPCLLFSVFCCIDIWACCPWGTAPPRPSQLLEIVSNIPKNTLFIHKPIQGPHSKYLFYWAFMLWFPIHLPKICQTTRDSPCAPEPAEITRPCQS